MFTVCLEYKGTTRYFYDITSVEIIKNYLYIYTDYGLLGRFDLSNLQNINIYPGEEDNNG